jgi:hypothetical protein
MDMATNGYEEIDDEVESTMEDEISDNPFYEGPDSAYFRADRGERGGALARQIAEMMEDNASEIDEIPLKEVVMKRHPRLKCLYMPKAERRRGHRRYRTVYCVDLGQSGGTWVSQSLEDQFKMLSILLHGDLMNKALEDGDNWKDILPTELIIITDRWDGETAQWIPMLRLWEKLVKSFELYLVAPGMAHRIEFE